MKKVTIFTLAILMGCGALFAQNSFRITVGGSMPIGNFGKAKVTNSDIQKWGLVDNTKYGGAGLGVCLGLQEKFGFRNVEGLGLTISLDGFFNGLNNDLDSYFDDVRDLGDKKYEDYTLHTPKYLNFAPMAGLNYEYHINDALGFFAEFGIGANYRKITNLSTDGKNSNPFSHYRTSVKYNSNITFAYKIGAGFIFKNKFILHLGYLGLGSAIAKGKAEVNGTGYGSSSNKIKNGKINPTLLTLSVGVQF